MNNKLINDQIYKILKAREVPEIISITNTNRTGLLKLKRDNYLLLLKYLNLLEEPPFMQEDNTVVDDEIYEILYDCTMSNDIDKLAKLWSLTMLGKISHLGYTELIKSLNIDPNNSKLVSILKDLIIKIKKTVLPTRKRRLSDVRQSSDSREPRKPLL
jgi:hypothetical protein